MTQINDIITNEDGILYAETALWCNENNACLEEIEPLEKEVEEKYYEMTDDIVEVEKTRSVKKTFRQFKIVPVPEPTVEEKNENIRLQRQVRFTQESDPLKLDYDEAVARGEEQAEEKKQIWLAKKDQIREELPYITIENTEEESSDSEETGSEE